MLVCADAISPLINLFGLNVYPVTPGKKQTNATVAAAAGKDRVKHEIIGLHGC